MEPDLVNEFVPGDQTMQPQGIQPLLPQEELRGGMELPTLKELAGNAIKNKAIDYAAKKIGLNAAQATGVLSILGMGSSMFAPLAAVSALSGRALGISEYLTNKRNQKAIQKNMKEDSQGNIKTIPAKIMNMQASAQDIVRGGGNIPASTKAPSAPAPTQSRHTSGIGGLHSGY